MPIKRIGEVFSRKSTKLWQARTSEFYSVIVCSVDNRRFACLHASLGQAVADQSYESIRISGAQSLCQGYSECMKGSRGSRLIFRHDDIEIVSDDFVARLEANFACFDVFGPVGTTRLIEGSWSAAGHPDIHGSIIQPDSSRCDITL